MIRPADPAEKSIFTADFKGQVSIGQVWVRMQIKSKPNARLASLQQTKRKVMMFRSQGSKRDDKISTRRRVWGTLGEKKLYRFLLQMGYYCPTMKKYTAEFVKKCHNCQVQANLIHTHPQNLHSMVSPWPFYTWRLDLVGLVNPTLRGYIWILMATEYFTKWAEAVPLCKAMGKAIENFIKEYIIVRFGVPHRIISDNGTPFVNSDVRKMLEFYQVKHHHSSPYYPQGNG